MHDVQHIDVYIARPRAEAYEFASDPRNLPRWAAGLARSDVRQNGVEARILQAHVHVPASSCTPRRGPVRSSPPTATTSRARRTR
jgi:hypothetical protein